MTQFNDRPSRYDPIGSTAGAGNSFLVNLSGDTQVCRGFLSVREPYSLVHEKTPAVLCPILEQAP
jgi:hypothetical protein